MHVESQCCVLSTRFQANLWYRYDRRGESKKKNNKYNNVEWAKIILTN